MRTLESEPTTAAEFAQSLIEDGVADWLLDKTPEQSSDTVTESDRTPRDPETGRFVPRQAETEEVETPEPPAEAETVEGEEASALETHEEDEELVIELDEDLERFLEKYDGDIVAALKGAANLQSKFGQQGNELGELRKQLEELHGLVQQNQINPMMFAPYASDQDEDPQGLVQEVLERAAQTGHFDDRTYEAAIASWADEDPFGAARMDARVSMVRQMVAQANQTWDAEAPQEPKNVEPDLENAMSQVVQRHPDIEKFIPAVGELAREFPTLRGLMEHGSPSEKAGAFEELVKIAKTRDQSVTSRAALKRVVLKTQEEVQKEKADAAVISAKNTSAASAEPTGLDLFYREFDRATGQLREDD